ncbi:MAG: hypothetical protein JWQ89_2555 [Devosia sp.]|uniref:hypothetical protein n=1 Tax=Devosia sp. TaxID=1871048 RepID=UPI0026324E8C|nr:hypothetical protein [Devosia sp.]MDB5540828.1 hypothetical protein [Devosia sp.]
MLTMMDPADVTKMIIDAAYQHGRQTAEVLHMCFPAVCSIDAVEPARDRMIEAVALPYLSTPHFSSTLLMGIKASAFCGFEECWGELMATAGDADIPAGDQAALEALDWPWCTPLEGTYERLSFQRQTPFFSGPALVG